MIQSEKVVTELKYIPSLKLKGLGEDSETVVVQYHHVAFLTRENSLTYKLFSRILSRISGLCWPLSWASLVTFLSSLKFSGAPKSHLGSRCRNSP